MICNKCNKKLPDDSEFCQYCGNKIEPFADNISAPLASVGSSEPDVKDMEPNEALKTILEVQVKQTIDAMEANSQSQPNNENDVDFGLVPENPIYTLARMSVGGEKEYLNKLYTANGEKIKYSRRGSMSVDGINGMIDIYDTFLPSGQAYKTIYINMYGTEESVKAPTGFILKAAEGKSNEKLYGRNTAVPFGPEEYSVTVNSGMAANTSKKKRDAVSRYVGITAIVVSTVAIVAIILAMNLQDIRRNVQEDINPTVIYFILIAVYGLCAAIIKAPVFGRVIAWPIPAILSIFALIEGSVFSSGLRYLNTDVVAVFNYVWVTMSVALLILWGITVASILFVKWHRSMYYKELCYRRVMRLHKYVESGVITEEEFEQNKKEILEKTKQ